MPYPLNPQESELWNVEPRRRGRPPSPSCIIRSAFDLRTYGTASLEHFAELFLGPALQIL
jgi:hypothetical protein